ncbi:GAP family protein [Actinomycetospora chibensis]|uniref:GAP family protein n=1 Tax=Actinomycetospora chibensis TaxID=663606 RepID=A0ABV9RLF5_9PSEU
MSTIDTFTPVKAGGLAVALSALNPKNLLITGGAAAAIAQTGIAAGGQAIALAVFVLVGTLGPALPWVIDLVLGARSADLLASLRTWMVAHNSAIMSVPAARHRAQAGRRRDRRPLLTARCPDLIRRA